MASTNAKYYGENGIHRVPLWRIAGFAANNLATNMYLFLMGYVAYYLTGFVGVAVVTASSFSMAMRQNQHRLVLQTIRNRDLCFPFLMVFTILCYGQSWLL